MVEYYKMKDMPSEGVIFRPKTELGKFELKVWDNETKKFYKEGQELGGQVVGNLYKNTPTARLTKSVNRNVFINGAEYIIPFPVSADRLLLGLMDTMKAIKQDPLQLDYVLKRTGTGLSTRYSVSVFGSAESNIELPQEKHEYSNTNEVLTEFEERILNRLLNEHSEYNKEQAIEVLKGYFPGDRTNLIAKRFIERKK